MDAHEQSIWLYFQEDSGQLFHQFLVIATRRYLRLRVA